MLGIVGRGRLRGSRTMRYLFGYSSVYYWELNHFQQLSAPRLSFRESMGKSLVPFD